MFFLTLFSEPYAASGSAYLSSRKAFQSLTAQNFMAPLKPFGDWFRVRVRVNPNPHPNPRHDHFVPCHTDGIMRRHTALCDAWAQVFVSGNIRPTKEIALPEGDGPTDTPLIGWDKGTDVCVYLTDTSPLVLDSVH